MDLPRTMKAIKVIEAGWAEIQEVTLPRIRDDYILIKVEYVALNPTDWKHIDRFPVTGATVGCDYSGKVVKVGSKVKRLWKEGDRIAGFVHGVHALELEDGCFAEYCVAKGDVQISIPDNISDEEAATLGVGIATVGQGLYQSLYLPLPGSVKAKIPLLVYGGSTATGSLAVQFASHSGCEIITTCSQNNFQFVNKLGATQAFDYKDPDCAKQIRAHTQDTLAKAFDCISEGDSPRICAEAVSSHGGMVSYLRPGAAHDRTDVANNFTLAYSITGEAFHFGGKEHAANLDDFIFAERFSQLATEMLAIGKVVVHPPKLGSFGLQGVLDGLQQLRDKKVSGVKLVYKVSETP